MGLKTTFILSTIETIIEDEKRSTTTTDWSTHLCVVLNFNGYYERQCFGFPIIWSVLCYYPFLRLHGSTIIYMK